MPIQPIKGEFHDILLMSALYNAVEPQQTIEVMNDNEILEFFHLLECSRYINERRFVPKSLQWVETILPELDEKRFRQQLRMNKQSFQDLIQLISVKSIVVILGDPVYKNSTESIPIQVAVGIHQLGTSGNGGSIGMTATKFGISEGSVHSYTSKIITSLNNLSQTWIRWPSIEERLRIGSYMAQKYLPKCIGFVDGSACPFYQAPKDDKETYWSRKKEYSMQFQIICDPFRQIRHFYTGYPGSVHDAKVFSSTAVSMSPNNYFSEGQFIIGDAAYSKSETVIVPYKRSIALTANHKIFNKHISGQRVIVEHTIGLLKGRFQSLKALRININKEVGHAKACKWIKACAVLHNFLSKCDPWNHDDDEMDLEANDGREDDGIVLNECNNPGELKRAALCEIVNAMYN